MIEASLLKLNESREFRDKGPALVDPAKIPRNPLVPEQPGRQRGSLALVSVRLLQDGQTAGKTGRDRIRE